MQRLVPLELNLIVTVGAILADKNPMKQLQNRRLAARLLCAEMVELTWRDATGREVHKVGNLEDISESGFCFQVEDALKAGTPVRLRYSPKGELRGTVRYSIRRDDAYVLGVQLDEGSEWSTRQFRPGHLLDPRELKVKPSLIDNCGPSCSSMIH